MILISRYLSYLHLQIPFSPNKVTFVGSRDLDVDISFGGLHSIHYSLPSGLPKLMSVPCPKYIHLLLTSPKVSTYSIPSKSKILVRELLCYVQNPDPEAGCLQMVGPRFPTNMCCMMGAFLAMPPKNQISSHKLSKSGMAEALRRAQTGTKFFSIFVKLKSKLYTSKLQCWALTGYSHF